MSNFPFLGHPSLQEIKHLKEYLNTRYDLISKHIEALQLESDNLEKAMADLKRAEAIIASEDNYNKNSSLERLIKAPTINESELFSLESLKYDNSETAVLVDALLKPWHSNIRARERIAYKIKKIAYLIEKKGIQKKILLDLQADLRDDGEVD